jgi:kynurenine formamidase
MPNDQPRDGLFLWDRISRARVVDLSHLLHPAMPRWPGDPPPEFVEVAQIQRDGYYLRRFSLGEHSGTHLNAPISFYEGGLSVDSYPASSLVAPAVVLDARAAAAANPDYALSLADVLAWEGSHGVIPPGSLALLYTGWQAKWDRPQEFLGLDDQGVTHFPGFSLAAARFLLAERAVAGLGTDTPGVEPGQDAGFAVNRLVLEQPRLVLENLANLDQLPPTGAVLIIGRLRLQGGSGSPASVLALVP